MRTNKTNTQYPVKESIAKGRKRARYGVRGFRHLLLIKKGLNSRGQTKTKLPQRKVVRQGSISLFEALILLPVSGRNMPAVIKSSGFSVINPRT